VLPFGALCLGFLASPGFIVGARLSNYPAKMPLLVTMVIVALVSFLSLHVLQYFTDTFQGIPVHKFVGLGDYLKDSFTHSSMKVSYQGDAEPFNLGRAGFLLPLGDALGFATGMLGGFAMLRSIPHCPKCRVYFSIVSRGGARFPDENAFARFCASLPDQPFARLGALTHFHSSYSPMTAKDGEFAIHFAHKRCSGCQDQFVAEWCSMYSGGKHHLVPQLSKKYFLNKTEAAPAPAPAPPQQPAARFGRRVV
jgi:hypothetical protein